jgi:hypothetical protein
MVLFRGRSVDRRVPVNPVAVVIGGVSSSFS